MKLKTLHLPACHAMPDLLNALALSQKTVSRGTINKNRRVEKIV